MAKPTDSATGMPVGGSQARPPFKKVTRAGLATVSNVGETEHLDLSLRLRPIGPAVGTSRRCVSRRCVGTFVRKEYASRRGTESRLVYCIVDSFGPVRTRRSLRFAEQEKRLINREGEERP